MNYFYFCGFVLDNSKMYPRNCLEEISITLKNRITLTVYLYVIYIYKGVYIVYITEYIHYIYNSVL